MLTAIRRKVMVGVTLFALVALLLTNGSMLAQTPPTTTIETPTSAEMDMDMASPAAGTAPMNQMMKQCMAMMEMMMTMMGSGDMSGMMATPGTGMESMGGMATPTTTPSP